MRFQFDNNSFEHDYILMCLEHFVTDLKTDKPLSQLLDAKACQLTAFMNGQIAAQLKARLSDSE